MASYLNEFKRSKDSNRETSLMLPGMKCPRPFSKPGDMMNQLVHFENAKRELQLATNVDEVKDLRDKAEALRLYMKQAGESLWMQNQCAEIKVRAERRAGELLKATVKPGNPQLSHDVTIKTLPDGISRKQSSRWQAGLCLPFTLLRAGRPSGASRVLWG